MVGYLNNRESINLPSRDSIAEMKPTMTPPTNPITPKIITVIIIAVEKIPKIFIRWFLVSSTLRLMLFTAPKPSTKQVDAKVDVMISMATDAIRVMIASNKNPWRSPIILLTIAAQKAKPKGRSIKKDISNIKKLAKSIVRILEMLWDKDLPIVAELPRIV